MEVTARRARAKSLVLLLSACLVAACATPESRIRKNPELFATFPPDVQENVRQGAIDIGYTSEMVRMALGKPDREYVRTTENGTSEVWSYTDTYTTRERQRVSADFKVRDADGRVRTVSDSVWVDVDREHEYERLRVEFDNGRVKAVELVRQ